jgi:hypothetical protein
MSLINYQYHILNLIKNVCKKKNCSPELLLLINKEQFKNMVGIYGGTNIYIPTSNEYRKANLAYILYSNYRDKEKFDIKRFIVDNSITKYELRYIKSFLKKMSIGGGEKWIIKKILRLL